MKAEASGRFFEKKLRKKLLRLGARCASASLRAQRSNPSFAKQAIVFLLFFAALHPVYAAQEVTYEPSNVQLSGTIVYEQFYGPPNFGEDPKTDAKVNVIELRLDAPIDVTATPESTSYGSGRNSFSGINRVGLVDLQYPAHGLDKLAGHHVIIKGQLYEQDNALQYNQVLMIVNSVSPSRSHSGSKVAG